MDKQTFNVNCCDKMKQLDKLYSLIFDYRQGLGKYQTLNSTERKVLNELTNLVEERETEVDSIQNKLSEFFTDKFYKYWRMTVKTIGSNGHEYIEKYMIYPYELIKENQYLCCVHTGNISDTSGYVSEFSDTGFTLDRFFRENLTIEMEEVTKEEFVNEAQKHMDKILDYRLDKLTQLHKI